MSVAAPPDEAQNKELADTYGQVFSAQFRFWPKELADYQSRVEAPRSGLASMPKAALVEQNLVADLRAKNRFKLKRKEPFEPVATEVGRNCIGLDSERSLFMQTTFTLEQLGESHTAASGKDLRTCVHRLWNCELPDLSARG